MKKINIIFLLFSIFSLSSCFKEENNVLILNNENFEKAIKNYEDIVVYFYLPLDDYCNKTYKNIERGAKELKENNIFMARVDCTTEKNIVEKLNIKKYPIIKHFNKGTPSDYKYSTISKNQLVEWLLKKKGQIVTNFEAIAALQGFKNNREFSIVYFGNDKKQIEEYTKAAKKLINYSFGIVEFEEGIKMYSKPGTIILFKTFMNEVKNLTEIKEEKIINFVKENTKPQLMRYDGRAVYITISRGKPGLILMADESSPEWSNYEKLMTKIMEKVSDTFQVVLTDIEHGMASKLPEVIGVKKSDLPCLKIMESKKNKKYKMKEEINESNILKFIQDWEEGNLKPDYRSEKEPRKNDGNVFNVVTTTFEKEVINNDKDVMLLLYSSAKWSCKEFIKNKYDILGKKLKEKNPNLRIAKVDLTVNEIESIKVNIVPLLKFFPANKKDQVPLECDSSKSVEEMIEFIKQNAFHKVEYTEEKKDEKTGDL